LGLSLACAPAAPPPASSGVPIATASSVAPEGPPAPSAADSGAPAVALIEPGGVGDIRIGRPIPSRHLADAEDARRRYDIRWIADAQPFEAFRIEDPPVIAAFDGPFHAWAKDNVGPLEPGRFADAAIAAAKAGAVVTWIVIEQPGSATAEGIGVGSTWDALKGAYPGATILRDPEWFDSRPTCRARLPGVKGVDALLSRCGKDNGDVVRMIVSAE
jgi:hypothetical protein